MPLISGPEVPLRGPFKGQGTGVRWLIPSDKWWQGKGEMTGHLSARLLCTVVLGQLAAFGSWFGVAGEEGGVGPGLFCFYS